MPKPAQDEGSVYRIVQAVRELFEGRSHAVGQVTLRASQATTTVESPNIGSEARIVLFPRTANASADFGGGAIYISSVKAGQFVITHPNDADVDKTFDWHALG
jgi:hypothetical protein